MSPLGSENLLVIMWPESFGGFTFDLGPLFQALLWSLMYNAYGTLKLVSEVFDVKTYLKPHSINVLMGSCLTLETTFKV